MSDRPPTRRRLLALSGGAFVAGFPGCLEQAGVPGANGAGGDGATPDSTTPTEGSTPQTTDSPGSSADSDRTLPEAIALETITDAVEMPVDVAFVPEEGLRYVASKSGLIHVHGPDGVNDEPLLDLRDAAEQGYEMGLLGVALHPDFADSRRLFVRYSAAPREDTPDDYNHAFVLSEFEVDDDGARADPDSERSVLELPQPQGNHNSGSIRFGPDGYLYVGTGDGGDANDTGTGHVDDWYDGNEGGNGQNTTDTLLGGVLRIDVDGRDGDLAYAIPEDNPLVDREDHRDEYFAWGLRNPWGMAFDDDRFFVADVGQNRREEVNLVERGGNYGWNVREGASCFDASDPTAVPEDCPDETPPDVRGGEPLIDPIIDYPNGEPADGEIGGAAIVGGQVYRGSALPELEGAYVFGDLQPAGRLFVGTPPDDGAPTEPWSTAVLDLDDAEALEQLLSIERDDDGEVYVLESGGVHRIVPAD